MKKAFPLRPLHKSACLEKTGHFDEVSSLSEPAYAGRLIGGERKAKNRKMDVFNEQDHLCKGLPLSKVYRLLEPGPVVMVSTFWHGKANAMTMSWHTMIDFEPPLVGCVISDQNYSFQAVQETKVCVINIPTADLALKVVEVGNSSGRTTDKFKKFHLAAEEATEVAAPLMADCYANLECKVIDTRMAKKYNLFILEVVKAWIRPSKKRIRMIHHAGSGAFIVDGKILHIHSKKK